MNDSRWLTGLACAALCLTAGCTAVPIRNSVAQIKKPHSGERARSHADRSSSVKSAKSDDSPSAAMSDISPVEPSSERVATVRKVSLSPSLVSSPELPASDWAPGRQTLLSVSTLESAADVDAALVIDEEAGDGLLLATGMEQPVTEGAEPAAAAAIPPTPEGTSEQPALPGAYPLSLNNILYLADAQNPNVAFARERINEAYARVDRADALWLPSLRAGVNYFHHEGNVQDVIGNVFETNKSAFYGGLGAGGAGSGSPSVPGIVAQFHLTDAIFQPKIAGHQAASRAFGATATRNDILRNSAVGYLELVRAEQAMAISEEALTNTRSLAKLTGEYARTGQGLRSDHERMLTEEAVREADVVSRREAIRVASARLAQLLHADPSVRITSNEPMVIPLTLLEGDGTAASFVATALTRRPELAEQKHLVCEAVERLRREKFAPLVPSVLLGMSYGGLGGGLGSSITNTNDRWDADAMAYWEIRNFGMGERAARNEISSVVRQAQQRELAIMDQVAREVVESHAQVEEREHRLAISRKAIAAAERSYRLNLTRIENAQGLPIETLQSVQALAVARQTYLNAVVDYNIAQFELCRALGWFETSDVDARHD